MTATNLDRVCEYHDGTKHHFDRFAPSLGYLDWASQPHPFRSFMGAPALDLHAIATADQRRGSLQQRGISYDSLFGRVDSEPLPISAETIGHFLRHALGLSAWKAFRGARWSLRVNPSSGNLHPTEAYVVTGPIDRQSPVGKADAREGACESPGVWHYASDRHVLERRCEFDRDSWADAVAAGATEAFFVVLTSIHWRESWKYGERAFRYCQHDLGHAVAALSLSAKLCGWKLAIDPAWAHRTIAALVGIDRVDDYVEAEREDPGCIMRVARSARVTTAESPALVAAAARGRWFGRASRLSDDHVRWSFIDRVAAATEDPGHPLVDRASPDAATSTDDVDRRVDAARLMLQRRSAVAFDGSSGTTRQRFLRMINRAMPREGPPWNAMWWTPRVHLALFVHRVDGVAPGLYALPRSAAALPRMQTAWHRRFAWTRADAELPLYLLDPGDYRSRSQRVSCDQDIAADGFFSLGMIAEFDASLAEHGASFYRHLFWETGVVGQILYLEAEAAGARATGIGCYYDDPVHRVLGIEGHSFQSLYHFTIGHPVEDTRLTTSPGYGWESPDAGSF